MMRRFVPEKWGGTETVVFNLARELEKEDLHSPIYCTDMFAKTGTEEIDGVTIRRFRYSLPWFGLDESAKSALRLKGGSPLSLPLFFALLFQKDLTLIHTHVGRRLGGIARTVAKIRRVPYVIHVHGGRHTVPQEQYDQMVAPVKGKLEWGKVFGFLFGSRRVFDDAAAVLCVGQSEADEMRARGQKNVHYLPNGVHVQRFAKAMPQAFRQAYGLEDQKFILCLSRIDFQKKPAPAGKSLRHIPGNPPGLEAGFYRVYFGRGISPKDSRRDCPAESAGFSNHYSGIEPRRPAPALGL